MQPRPGMVLTEALGRGAGRALAPLVAAGARARRARLFHPRGQLFKALVRPLASEGQTGLLAQALSGTALVRLSAALRKRTANGPDILGCAIRCGDPERLLEPSAWDQDLLFATARSPWTLPLALFTTTASDFLANRYFGIAPFEVEGLGLVKLRLVGVGEGAGEDRDERLRRALANGRASFRMELRPVGRPGWVPLVSIDLREPVMAPDSQLTFDPFRAGRGIRPRGFIQALRLATYPASQKARLSLPH